ncbi:efflux RND transporter permease subunit [Planctomycetaceae bacterium SH139]
MRVHRRVNHFLASIVDHPLLGTLLILVLTVLAVIGYRDPNLLLDQLRPKAVEQAVETVAQGTESTAPLPDVNPLRLGEADAILLIGSDQIFTPAGMRALRETVSRLEALPQVSNVMWMDRAPIINIFGLPEPIFPRGNASDTLLEASRRKALSHPLVAGQLLSPDGKYLQLMISIDWLFVENDEAVSTDLAEVAEQAIAAEPEFQASVQVTGPVPLYLASWRSSGENQLRYQLIGYSVIGIAALILFRGPAAVFIVALAPALGVFWTLGFLRYFQLEQNPFNDVILPTLLSLLGLTDGVHMMVQIRHHRAAGLPPRDAARRGAQEVGLACVLTSVTTAIGFGSLSLAGHEVVRDFGWCCVLGVFLMLIAILTVIPLACSTILGRRVHAGHHSGVVQRQLGRISVVIDFAIRRRRLVSTLAIASTVLCAVVAAQLEPDERRQQGLPTRSPAVQAIQQMDKSFGGLESARVWVRWSAAAEEQPDAVLEMIKRVHGLLDEEELLGSPLSIASLIEALPGRGPAGSRMALADLLPPPLKRAFYTPETRTAFVSFRVQDLGIARYAEVFERLEPRLATLAEQHPGFELELAGSAVRRWQNLYRIVIDLAASLGAASIIIFIVLGLVFRSLRIGLISIIPNMFPLVLTGALLVWMGQGLELVSVCAFTVCLGIAVDDTIHFMTRYLECRETGVDDKQAIHDAFVGVGTALITTTVVLVAGFITVMLSDSREHVIFAGMGIMTFLSALFADIFFLPALLAQFAGNDELASIDSRADDAIAVGASESPLIQTKNENTAAPL